MEQSAFVKLFPVGRVSGYMGLRVDQGVEIGTHRRYQYVEVPMRPVLTDKGNPRKIIKQGERVVLEAAATLCPSKCHVDVVTSGLLESAGTCSYQRRVADGEDSEILVTFVPYEDMDLNTIMSGQWFVRLYAVS